MPVSEYRIARFSVDGVPRVAVVVGGNAIFPAEFEGLGVNEVILHWERLCGSVEGLVSSPDVVGVPVADLELLSPAAPTNVFHAGANYRQHVIDLSVAHADASLNPDEARAVAVRELDEQEANGSPYIFIGLSSSVASVDAPLILPNVGGTHDWELELAAVIGTEAYRVAPEVALDHVFGYTIVNDVTTREFVMRKDVPTLGADWFRSKNAPGFLPTGPYVTPRAFVADPQQLQIRLDVNGVTRQEESTADMIFPLSKIIATISQTTRLLPGDLVLTGSPRGNGMHYGVFLGDGDVMEGSVSGLGVQRVRCTAEV